MKLLSPLVASVALIAPPTTMDNFYHLARNSPQYDTAASPIGLLICSPELDRKGYSGAIGTLPPFPNVGGVFAVTTDNQTACGTCWELSREGRNVNVLGVNTVNSIVGEGFELSIQTLAELAGQDTIPDHFYVSAKQVDSSECGF